MDVLQELNKYLEEELQFEIKQLGHVFEHDELINIGASIYTLNRIKNKLKSLEESENDVF